MRQRLRRLGARGVVRPSKNTLQVAWARSLISWPVSCARPSRLQAPADPR
jgi:hypothetical protein